MALVVSDVPAAAGGIFTTNQFPAAPVMVSQRHLRQAKQHRGVLLNAGGANACTGAAGLADAQLSAVAAQERSGIQAERVVAVEDAVDIIGPDGRLIARGLSCYDSDEASRVQGLRSNQITGVLGERGEEIVHRDELTVFKQ